MNTSHNFSPHSCASQVLDVVPAVMRCIHTEIRQQRSTCLTISQIRALAFLETNAGASIAGLAEYLGITSASTSATIERLVQREFVTRTTDPKLRRKVILNLTIAGAEHLQKVRQTTCDRIADRLAQLPADRLASLTNGLEELSQIFVDFKKF